MLDNLTCLIAHNAAVLNQFADYEASLDLGRDEERLLTNHVGFLSDRSLGAAFIGLPPLDLVLLTSLLERLFSTIEDLAGVLADTEPA